MHPEVRLFDFHLPQEDGFTIQMFGINECGETYSICIPDYKPCFYCKVSSSFSKTNKYALLDMFQSKIKDEIEGVLVQRKKLDGFDGQKEHSFLCLKFQSMKSFQTIKNLWYEDIPTKDGKRWGLKPSGFIYQGLRIALYEANIPPLLRFFHVKEISPSGWIRLPTSVKVVEDKTTTCTYEVITSAKDIVAIKKETLVPYKVCSFDIEASSSHGDFPVPIKDYKKVAQQILEIYPCSLEKCMYTAFGYDTLYGIDLVYPKKPVEKEWLEDACRRWLSSPLKDYTSTVPLFQYESDSEDEHEVKAYDSHKTVLDMLQDKVFDKESKLMELKKSLDTIFPSLEGDKVTFIGSTFWKYGESVPYLNHCIVLGGCSPLEGAVIESYQEEKGVLLAWKDLIQRENPDILIGYNIFGFDEDFMFHRAVETKCVEEFLDITRTTELAGKEEKNKWKIEETSIFLASGEHCLKYFKTIGRVQIDLYNLFRRDYNLESYKLDSVSTYFIGDKVKRIEHVDNVTKVYSKNLRGLEKNNYVIFEEISHSSNYYRQGKKFKVMDVQSDHFVLNNIVNPNMKLQVKWGLSKDDVSPQDIFRLANGTDDDRRTIAAYCIQDCNLVHHLFNKIDVLTGFIEMSSICSVPISFLVMRGQGIKLTSFIAKKCREKGVLMPVLDKTEGEDGYEGAIVLDPKCNFYAEDPIAVNDYSSLYPSSMISDGLSHDSKVWTKEYNLEGELIEEKGEKGKQGFLYDNLPGYTYLNVTYDTYTYLRTTPKGKANKVKCGYKVCRFAQFPVGRAIMPAVLEELLAARTATKKLISKQQDEFMKNILDKRQLAYKLTANSLYGQCGAKTSTFYDKDVAASCTAVGRKLLIYAKQVIETVYKNKECDTCGGKVMTHAEYVYGDTDSVFFKFNLTRLDGTRIVGQEALPITIELAKEAGRLATMFLKPPHDLEYEKTFLPFILLSKKRYVGILYEEADKPCYRNSMGIVLKRRDNAPIVKDVYGGVIDILMKGNDVVKAVEFVKDSLSQLMQGRVPLDKLMITKSLRSGYKNPKQIAHKVLADRMGVRDSGNKPRPGDRIPYVYIESTAKLQGDKIETPEYIKQNNLKPDYKHYITNQIMKPVQQVFALVLESLPEFHTRAKKFERDRHELREKHDDDEFHRKYESLRDREVKELVFDEYLNARNKITNYFMVM
jgi:DNA polymerase elongation subunit (family B)